jgi:hypothetical protein
VSPGCEAHNQCRVRCSRSGRTSVRFQGASTRFGPIAMLALADFVPTSSVVTAGRYGLASAAFDGAFATALADQI